MAGKYIRKSCYDSQLSIPANASIYKLKITYLSVIPLKIENAHRRLKTLLEALPQGVYPMGRKEVSATGGADRWSPWDRVGGHWDIWLTARLNIACAQVMGAPVAGLMIELTALLQSPI